MARRRSEVGKRRREQIVEAAVGIIAEQGLQHLSLSAIESRAHMSRGQLTYYFPAKEDILLAVFDHMIATMQRRASEGNGPPGCPHVAVPGWEHLRTFLGFFILHPPEVPEFHALQYTFLSQIGHRDDFRQRLASLYELWRSHLASDFAHDLPTPTGRPSVSARTLASFVQALLHGLAMQRVAEPASYDRQEMLTLCTHLLGSYLGKDSPSPAPVEDRPGDNGKPRRRRSPRTPSPG